MTESRSRSSSDAMSTAIEYDGATKVYARGVVRRRPLRAVDGISLKVESGEAVGLLGPNRAGKTTLVKLLLGLCTPTSGRVSRLGRPVSDRATLARVGYVHEAPAFPRHLSARGLLDYYGALTLVPSRLRRERMTRLLERVGLADRADESIARFSKGMVRRLALAQALVNEPELLVLDEPAEGLDLPGQALVEELLGDHRRRGGTTLPGFDPPAAAGRPCWP